MSRKKTRNRAHPSIAHFALISVITVVLILATTIAGQLLQQWIARDVFTGAVAPALIPGATAIAQGIKILISRRA